MIQIHGEARTAQGRTVLQWAWVHPHPVCLLPQCEQFVEQHLLQLQSLVSRGWDAHTTCQVSPLISDGPRTFPSSRSPPPSLAHDPQKPPPGVQGSPLPPLF